jgi:hypothetical protein
MILMREWLTIDLKVSPSYIQELVNEKATRSAIVDSVSRLGNSSAVKYGDAILIYFAGHGCLAGDKQALVPYDAPSIRGDLNQLVSDVKLASLLGDLAKKKGDNIVRALVTPTGSFKLIAPQTVILDCCHSASGTRGDESWTFRGVEFKNYTSRDDVPTAFITECESAGTRSLAKNNLHRFAGLGSHILLAACAEDEQARESLEHGLFTKELIEHLKLHGVDEYTNASLILNLQKLARRVPAAAHKQHLTIFA